MTSENYQKKSVLKCRLNFEDHQRVRLAATMLEQSISEFVAGVVVSAANQAIGGFADKLPGAKGESSKN